MTARLPWSHIDIGLEDGFLAREYRKALQSRLSPPCGKVAGAFVHHATVEDAEANRRRLVCYDCGVACDMTQMRDERIDFLARMDAHKRLPLLPDVEPHDGEESGAIETHAAKEEEPGEPVASTLDGADDVPPASPPKPSTARKGHRYRFRFEKLGPVAMLGHLDLVREVPRVLRRSGAEMVYTSGFHPKPDLSFGPALSLGVSSLDEYVDVRLAAELDPPAIEQLLDAMNALSPRGLVFRAAVKLGAEDAGITRVIGGARYLLVFARSALGADAEATLDARCRAVMETKSLPFRREIEGIAKMIDVRSYLLALRVSGPEAAAALARAGLVGDLVALDAEVVIPGSGAVKSSEIAAVAAGDGVTAPPHRAVRVALFGRDGEACFSPLELERARAPRSRATPPPTPSAEPVALAGE